MTKNLAAALVAPLALAVVAARASGQSAGALDASFGGNGYVLTDFGGNNSAQSIVVQPDGKIVAAGEISDATSYSIALLRLLPNGTLDSGFGSGGIVVTRYPEASGAMAAVLAADGAVLVTGYRGNRLAVLRYDAKGVLDERASFTLNFGGDNAIGHGMALQPDGKLLIAGDYGYDLFVVRCNPDGTMDEPFGSGGTVRTNLGGDEFGNGIAVQKDGGVVVAGRNGANFLIVRYQGGR